MPFVGCINELPSPESCQKTWDSQRVHNLFFLHQNAWRAPYARTYVAKLFKEAPQAKEAVRGKLAIVTGVTKNGTGYFMAEELAVSAEMHVILMGQN